MSSLIHYTPIQYTSKLTDKNLKPTNPLINIIPIEQIEQDYLDQFEKFIFEHKGKNYIAVQEIGRITDCLKDGWKKNIAESTLKWLGLLAEFKKHLKKHNLCLSKTWHMEYANFVKNTPKAQIHYWHNYSLFNLCLENSLKINKDLVKKELISNYNEMHSLLYISEEAMAGSSLEFCYQ